MAGSVCRPVEAGETFDAALCDAAPNCDWVQSDSGCCDGIGDAMDCGCGQGLMGLLGGLIKPSDHSFDDFVSPMINFVFFEDPRTLTELRPIFVNHWVPGTIGTGIPAGGSIQLLAMQFRVAITERLSVIAVKDGYIFDNTGGALNGRGPERAARRRLGGCDRRLEIQRLPKRRNRHAGFAGIHL